MTSLTPSSFRCLPERGLVTPRFILGVDLGQVNDYTALVVLERVGSELHARHIERLPLGISYPDQVARIAALIGSPELARDVLVAVDATGVGRAVTDLLRAALGPSGHAWWRSPSRGEQPFHVLAHGGRCQSVTSSQVPRLRFSKNA